MNKNLIGVTEAAKLRGMSAAMVRRWCQLGLIKSAIKLAGVWIVDRDEILSFKPARVGRKPKARHLFN